MHPPDQTLISSAPTQPLRLEPVSGPGISAIEVVAGRQITVGRSSQCQVVLPDESISRRHATIQQSGATWIISDLESRHGTYLNAVKLAPNTLAPLKRGDLVGMGPWSFRVRIGKGDDSPRGTTTLGTVANTKEVVERVAERELAQVTRNRLNLLIEVAAAVAAAQDEYDLARTITEAAVNGTRFPRAALLREGAFVDEVRVICEVSPQGTKVDRPVRPSSGDLNAMRSRETAPELPLPPMAFSRSLISEARKGEVVRLSSDAPLSTAASIMSLGIQTALCAPIMLGNAAAGFLYLDARAGEQAPPTPTQGPTGGARDQRIGGPPPAPQADAAAFLSALAKMYALALANVGRVELEKRQADLERDLDAAREAQQMIMPPEKATIGTLSYAVRVKSGRYVAGDLFDVIELPDGRVAFFLGDVAGKGVGAAIYMATAQTHLSVALSANADPAAAVTAVNKRLSTLGMGSRFISLWLCVLDPATRVAHFIDAGHGYCLRFHAGGGLPKHVLSSSGIPLGIDPDAIYTAETLALDPGDRVIVFSDGVVEQPGAENSDDQFGMERAAQALEPSTNPESDVALLFKAVFAHAGSESLADDTTVASLEVR